jgi:DNA primase
MPAQDPRAQAQEQKRAGLQDWLELAAKWFEATLNRPQAKEARAYLAKRGLPEDQWERFRLGYAPAERTALRDALVQRGAKPADLVEAGLLIAPEGGGQPYDRFRDRIIFPITDGRGRIVSFGGRAMNPEDRAKYLNGPETPLFHKGRTLYGLPEARRLLGAGADGAALVVVEGYMDVIACQRAGVAAVAPLGTALTEEQMELLWRIHPEPTLSFDGDKAGLRAAYRSLDRALPLLKPGRSFRFALLSGGQDPDDVLRDKGALALREVLAQTRPFVEVLFQRERESEALDTPERRAGLKGRLRQAAAAIQDKDLSEQYRADLLERFDALFQELRAAARPAARPGTAWRGGGGRPPFRGGRGAAPEFNPGRGAQAAENARGRLKPLTAAVAVAAVEHPDWAMAYDEALERQGFGHPAVEGLAKDLVAYLVGAGDVSGAGCIRQLERRGWGDILLRLRSTAAEITPPFLDSQTAPEEARRLWARSYELVIETASVEAALSELAKTAATVEQFAEQRRLRAARMVLEKEASDLSFWRGE